MLIFRYRSHRENRFQVYTKQMKRLEKSYTQRGKMVYEYIAYED